MSLLRHIPTQLKKAAKTNGGEYKGPCPWCGGKDRFSVSPAMGESGLYVCRQCERAGDGIQFMRDFYRLDFPEACERLGLMPDRPALKSRRSTASPELLRPPCEVWQERAWSFAEECEARFWSEEGARALAWLRGRGLSDKVIRTASMGYNPADVYEKPGPWGLKRDKDIWLPRGITIPWVIGGEIWRVNIRRPAGEPKYFGPAGFSNGLYWSDRITPDLPVMLVEGEIDAWSVMQEAHEIITAVATGSTSGARRLRWESLLTLASVVLVAFDNNKAGEKAARYWLETLPNAVRWRPYWADVNQMLQDGADVRSWVLAGLQCAGCSQVMSAAN